MWYTRWMGMALVVALLAGSGCARKQYQYLDNDDVRVEKLASREEGQFLQVNATLRNRSDSAITNTVYRVEWYDKNGTVIEQSSWRPVSVRGAAPAHIQERSTVPGAVDFTILLSNDAR